MKISVRKCWTLAALAVLCLAAGAFAQNGTSTQGPDGARKVQAHSIAPATVQAAASVKAGEAGKVSQKLFIYVPESPSFLIFAADMLGLAGLVFLFRRRLLGSSLSAGAGCSSERGSQ